MQWNETLQVYNNPLQVNGQPFTGRENLRQKIAIGRGSSLFFVAEEEARLFHLEGLPGRSVMIVVTKGQWHP